MHPIKVAVGLLSTWTISPLGDLVFDSLALMLYF